MLGDVYKRQGLNRAIAMIAEAKPGRMSSSIIKDLGEHPELSLIHI